MILTQDGLGQLMIDRSGNRFIKPLTDAELQEVKKMERLNDFIKISSLFSDDQAEEHLETLLSEGFSYQEIIDLSLESEA